MRLPGERLLPAALVLLLFCVPSAASQSLEVEGLEAESVNTSFGSDEIQFSTSYMNQSLSPKQVFVPQELEDELDSFTYSLQSFDEDEWPGVAAQLYLQVQYGGRYSSDYPTSELSTVLGANDTDTGNLTPHQYIYSNYDYVRTSNSTSEVFDMGLQDGPTRFEINVKAHYEHLIIEYEVLQNVSVNDSTNTTEQVVWETKDVYTGEETAKLPFQYCNTDVDNGVQSLSCAPGNRYEDSHEVTVLTAYPDNYSFDQFTAGDLDATPVSEASNWYSEAEQQVLENNLSEDLLIPEDVISDYRFKAYNVTLPADSTPELTSEILTGEEGSIEGLKMYVIGSIGGTTTYESEGGGGSIDSSAQLALDLDEESSPSIDDSGQGHDATWKNSPTPTTGGIQEGEGLDFNDNLADGDAVVPESDSFFVGSPAGKSYSMELEVQGDHSTDSTCGIQGGNLFNDGAGCSAGYMAVLQNDGDVQVQMNSEIHVYNTDVAENNPSRITFVFHPSSEVELEVYKNGDFIGSNVFGYSSHSHTEGSIWFGSAFSDTRHMFNGILYDYNAYDKELTQDEIDSLNECGYTSCNIPPQFSELNSDPVNWTKGESFDWNASVSDPDGNLVGVWGRMLREGNVVKEWTEADSLSGDYYGLDNFYTPGEEANYTLEIKANDTAGAYNISSTTQEVVITNQQPQVDEPVVTPSTGVETGTEVNVSVNVSDPDSNLASVNISLLDPEGSVEVDNASMTNNTAEASEYYYSFTIPGESSDVGEWTATVTATDEEDASDSNSTTFNVSDGIPPNWFNLQTNATDGEITSKESLNISAEWRDNQTGFNKAVLSTNETGTWKNYTFNNGSYIEEDTLSHNASITGLDFENDGNTLMVSDTDRITRYSCSVSYKVSSCSATSDSSQINVNYVDAFEFNSAGDKLVAVSRNSLIDYAEIYELSCSQSFEPRSCSVQDSFSYNPDDADVSNIGGIHIYENSMFLGGRSVNKIVEFACSGPYDVSTCSGPVDSLSTPATNEYFGISFTPDGEKLYSGGEATYEFKCSTGFNLSTCGNRETILSKKPTSIIANPLEEGFYTSSSTTATEYIVQREKTYNSSQIFNNITGEKVTSSFRWKNESFDGTLGYKIWGKDAAGNWNQTETGSVRVQGLVTSSINDSVDLSESTSSYGDFFGDSSAAVSLSEALSSTATVTDYLESQFNVTSTVSDTVSVIEELSTPFTLSLTLDSQGYTEDKQNDTVAVTSSTQGQTNVSDTASAAFDVATNVEVLGVNASEILETTIGVQTEEDSQTLVNHIINSAVNIADDVTDTVSEHVQLSSNYTLAETVQIQVNASNQQSATIQVTETVTTYAEKFAEILTPINIATNTGSQANASTKISTDIGVSTGLNTAAFIAETISTTVDVEEICWAGAPCYQDITGNQTQQQPSTGTGIIDGDGPLTIIKPVPIERSLPDWMQIYYQQNRNAIHGFALFLIAATGFLTIRKLLRFL